MANMKQQTRDYAACWSTSSSACVFTSELSSVTKTDVYAKIPTQNNDMKVEAGSGLYFSSRAHLKVTRL